jgi:hypothetical protein
MTTTATGQHTQQQQTQHCKQHLYSPACWYIMAEVTTAVTYDILAAWVCVNPPYVRAQAGIGIPAGIRRRQKPGITHLHPPQVKLYELQVRRRLRSVPASSLSVGWALTVVGAVAVVNRHLINLH